MSHEFMPRVDERMAESAICEVLRAGISNRSRLAELALSNSSVSDHRTLADLLGSVPYEVLRDTSDWNSHPHLSADLFGGCTPDIVMRTPTSRVAESLYANRIIIEVKWTAPLREPREASQAVRYFVHLLTTTSVGSGSVSGHRGLILAAPQSWWSQTRNCDAWSYFRRQYADLAGIFGITLAELRLDDLVSAGGS